MKVILHSNAYCERGDSVNARNYHYALKKILGIDSVLAYEANNPGNNHIAIDSLLKEEIPMFAYSSLSDLHQFAKSEKFTHSYLMKSGAYDAKWISNTINCVHAVFNVLEPHGDKYAYVSEWLFKEQFKKKEIPWNVDFFRTAQASTSCPYFPDISLPIGWVPHIVNPPEPSNPKSFREKINIPNNTKVIGRIGGYSEFNDPAAIEGIKKILSNTNNIYFIFINTKPFFVHENIRYLNSYISESDKADFFKICNLTLNGRLRGESFGFSVCESLYYGVPVIGPDLNRNPTMDAHHIDLLRPFNFLYQDSDSFEKKIYQLLDQYVDEDLLKSSVKKFSPDHVMNKFNDFFLKI